DGRARQAAPEDRRRLRPRARRLRLGDGDQATTQESLIQPLALEQRIRPTTRRTLESSTRHRPPLTRDPRQRQLPTDTGHPVPTRECQSDPPSLLRTIRCSRPRGQPQPSRTLDPLLHVRGRIRMSSQSSEADEGAADREESRVDLVTAVAADEQPFEVEQPGEGAL